MSLLQLAAGAGVAPQLYADDCFACYTYTGTGSSQTITNGIDLSGQGGMVWQKGRSGATSHVISDTSRGVGVFLETDNTGAQSANANSITAFNSNGFSFGSLAKSNTANETYASWALRNAPKFYNHTTVVKSASSNATVDLSTLGTVGMVRVKRTDSTGSWYIWHRSLTAGKLLIGETTAAEATLGHITVSGTTVTLVDGVIADGTYLVEGFAHDTSATGIIQCGSFTTDGSGNATVNLGWEPQYLLYKASGAVSNWAVLDTARAFAATATSSSRLAPNTSSAESTGLGGSPSATGFYGDNANMFAASSTTYIYLAIRRPNKPPTTGTQVYQAIARTGTGAAATVTGVGFAPDSVLSGVRNDTFGAYWWDRLRGALVAPSTASTGAEASWVGSLAGFDAMDGFRAGDGTDGLINRSAKTYINWCFKRAPGFFDEVCYTGTGSAHTEAHNLGAVPELMIVKKRSAADAWYVYAGDATDYLVLNTTAATADLDTIWNDTAPTSTVFTVGTHDDVNQSGGTFVTYLFATLAGISKCFSYTGDGGTVDNAGTGQTIDCGFAAGARFVLLKCTSHTSDWVIVDVVRGLVAGNDPALSLNTTAAEVTSTDLLDPTNVGFIVNQLASGTTSANFNVTGRTYIGLAIS